MVHSLPCAQTLLATLRVICGDSLSLPPSLKLNTTHNKPTTQRERRLKGSEHNANHPRRL